REPFPPMRGPRRPLRIAHCWRFTTAANRRCRRLGRNGRIVGRATPGLAGSRRCDRRAGGEWTHGTPAATVAELLRRRFGDCQDFGHPRRQLLAIPRPRGPVRERVPGDQANPWTTEAARRRRTTCPGLG